MELKEYTAPLLKWWWLIVVSTVIAAGTSYWAASRQPPLYSTTATIIVGNAIENPNPSNNELNITQQLASFYVDLANRPSVRNAAREALGLSAMPEIFVSQLNNTNVIDIAVRDTNPARAQAVANELARQLVLRSPTAQEDDLQRQEFVNGQLDNYETAIKETEQQIAEKQDELGTLTSAREIRQVQNDISSLEGSLQTLRRDYATLLGNTGQGATNTIRIIESAALPQVPINNNALLSVATAAGVGFVLAASAAFVLEFLDDTIKLPSHVSRQTDVPTLAGIAEIDAEDMLVTVREPRSPISEAFRVLRTDLQFAAVDNPRRTILVTSSTPQEGKSTVSANLAVVMAQAGYNVLLVDTDLRRPALHGIFDLPNKRGLTSLLLDLDMAHSDDETRVMVNDVVQATRVEGLQLLSSGPIPPNPSELVGSKMMGKLMQSLLKQYDYLIFDSPPILSVTDAVVLSTRVDGTLVVVRANRSRRSLFRQAMQQLDEVHANVVGCILNALTDRSEGYNFYYYYRHDYYGQGPGAPVAEEAVPGKLRERLLHRETKGALSR